MAIIVSNTLRLIRYFIQPCVWFFIIIRRRLKTSLVCFILMSSVIVFFVLSDTISDFNIGDDSPEYLDKVAKTAACKLPNINPFHESILPYIKDFGELKCGKALSTFKDNILRVEGENIVAVKYRTLTRPPWNDDAVNISEPFVVSNLLSQVATGKRQQGPIKLGGYGCIVHKLTRKCLHPYGGVGLPSGLQPVVFHEDCCDKRAYFKMLDNGAMQHVQSGRCLRQKRPGPDGTEITLHQKCETKFRADNGLLQAVQSQMCLQPASGRDDPANNEESILGTECGKPMQQFYFDFKEGTPFRGEAHIDTDFIRVEIETGGAFDDVIETHMQTAVNSEVLRRPVKSVGIPVNIAMIMFDSTSAANFIRKMPQTVELLNKTLDTVFLRGQTIVGDGTTAQLSAILTGIAEKNQPEARKGRKNAKTVDNWRWIFKEYAKQGYVTMYSEDSPAVGAFNYRLKGFRDPPTDHYGRYFWLEAENYIRNEHCTGNQAMHNLTFNYLLSLFRTYKKNPKFALINFSGLVHRDPNAISFADGDLYNLLQTMKHESFLDNTIVIIFGDHGYRFGGMRKQTLQGKLEERLPHFSITVPPSFTTQRRSLYKNLKYNSRLMTSPFDIYATLKHILSYPWSPGGVGIGQSLFKRINPRERKCSNAGVKDHWCPCLLLEKVPVKDEIVQELAWFTVSHMNGLINATGEARVLCRRLTLKEVKSAARELPSQVVQTFKFSYQNRECDSCGVKLAAKAQNTMVKDTLYQITLVTSPNGGVYEASISLNGGVPTIDGEISRADSIESQADCIKDSYVHLIKFCDCSKGSRNEAPILDKTSTTSDELEPTG